MFKIWPKIIHNFFLVITVTSAGACGMRLNSVESQTAPKTTKSEMATSRSGQDGRTCLKVVNGIEVDQMPGLVMVETRNGFCTGTFLGPNVVLTAAHCIDGSATGNVKIWGKISPIAVFHAGIAGESAFVQSPSLDVALLLLPEQTSRGWRKIAATPPKPGDRMMVVGYGRTAVTSGRPADGKLRYGHNTISEVSPQDAVMTYDAPKDHKGMSAGEESMGAPGDSGGPIFVNNSVVGVTNGGGLRSNGLYAVFNFLLFSAPGLKALEAAESKGAKINGINNVRKALGVPTKAESPDTDSLEVQEDASC